jgi:hypothetical protein
MDTTIFKVSAYGLFGGGYQNELIQFGYHIFTERKMTYCPNSGLKYQRKKPPDEMGFGERIDDWKYIVARPT